ncbi:hypothetical protein GCM10027601_05190 [Nocardioides ungokensis]
MSHRRRRPPDPYDQCVIRPTRSLRPLLPLVALALVAGGCGTSGSADQPSTASARLQRQGDAPSGQSRDASPTPQSGVESSPSSAPTRTAPTRTATARPSRSGRQAIAPSGNARPAALEAHLLAAEDMPDMTPGTEGGWTVGDTGPETSGGVGACQKTSLQTIGAVSAVRRTYVDPQDENGRAATQVVARFADAKSAWRAREVLRSWREDCEAEVGPMRDVDVVSGAGEHYRATYGATPRRARTADLGIVAHGAYLCLVEITAPSADYPDHRAPARAAVRRISRTFA